MDFNQDLVTSTAPIYYLSVVIGLATTVNGGVIGNRRFSKGRFHWVYHLAFLLIHLFFILISFYLKNLTYEFSPFDSRIVLFGIYTSLFISIVVLFCHHIFRFGLHKTVGEIYDLDKQMEQFGIRINHGAVYKNCLGITVFLIITAIWFCIITRESTFLFEIYFFAIFFVQYLITMTMKSQFCFINILLKYRFIALDTKLREVIDSTRDISGKQNNLILVQSVEKTFYSDTLLSPLAIKIITMSEYHSKLYNISKRINLYFSVQILLITGKYFVEITATLYYNLRKFYNKKDGEDIITFYSFAYFIWAVMNAIDLLILVYACDSMCSAVSISVTKSQNLLLLTALFF